MSVACESSKEPDTVAAIDACVVRHTPAIADPLFRDWTRRSVRKFCAYAGGEASVLRQNGSVSATDEKRILQSHPEAVSDICAAPIVMRKLPSDPKTLQRKTNILDAEHKKVCSIFLRRLH